jgi:hypothetical protein
LAVRWRLTNGGLSSKLTHVTSPGRLAHAAATTDSNWSGYETSSSNGWTQAQVKYSEPAAGVTHCPGSPGVSFWDGVQNSQLLLQDGTQIGYGVAAQAWWEAFSGNTSQGNAPTFTWGSSGSRVYVHPGQRIVAVSQYNANASSANKFIVYIDGQPHVAYYKTVLADGPGKLDVYTIERRSSAPLINFQSVKLFGYSGRGATPLPSGSPTYGVMPNYAKLLGIVNGGFTIRQISCKG